MVVKAYEYPYSSAQFYCSGIADKLTDESPNFVEFGQDLPERRITYKSFLADFDSEEERCFMNFEAPQGNKEFVRRLIRENGRYLPRRKGRVMERFVL